MNYIVFDLEFNQDITNPTVTEKKASHPFEILQIGAIKLDANKKTIANFNRLVKPTIYSVVSPFITELTGITTKELQNEETFPTVFQSFLDFLGSPDTIFVSWGKTDIKELYRTSLYHQFDLNRLPKQYIDIQPYASLHLHKPQKKLLRLQYTVEALCLPQPFPYHNALHDAYYTTEVFKKIMNPSIQPTIYHPNDSKKRSQPRQLKRTIDFEALIAQFEKMYDRSMTEEEQAMIKLAYQMGKTEQFLTPLS